MNLGKLHHRFCKKIAQIIKVIFFLNTKNVEYVWYFKAAVQENEKKMDQIGKQVNQIIFTYKQALNIQKRIMILNKNQNSFKKKLKQRNRKLFRIKQEFFRKYEKQIKTLQQLIKDLNAKYHKHKQKQSVQIKQMKKINGYSGSKRSQIIRIALLYSLNSQLQELIIRQIEFADHLKNDFDKAYHLLMHKLYMIEEEIQLAFMRKLQSN